MATDNDQQPTAPQPEAVPQPAPAPVPAPEAPAADPAPAAPAPAADQVNKEIVTPHASRLAEIVARRQERLQEELTNQEQMTGTPGSPADGASAEGAPAAQPAPAPATPPVAAAPTADPAAPPAGELVELVVNGQKVTAHPDDLIRLAQRGLSADQRFQEAANMRRQAEQIMYNGQQQPTQPPAAQHAPAAPQNAPAGARSPVVMDDKTARDLAERISYGSTEEQALAIRDIVANAVAAAAGQGQTLTPEQAYVIGRQGALDVVAQQQFDSNLRTVFNEYPEVINDRPLMVAAADRVQALRAFDAQRGVQRADLDLYREACGFIKERYVVSPAASTANQPANPNAPSVQAASTPAGSSNVLPMGDRFERKRAAPQPPAAATKIASEQGQSTAPNASQVVQQMRKARGQPAN